MNMSANKRWRCIFVGLVLSCVLPLPALAQNARLHLDNLQKLSEKATEVNDVTLDGAMLDIAAKFLDASKDPDAAQVKEVIKGIKGIYIKSFEFDQPDQYSQADVEEIRAQLAAPGWSRIVQSRNRHEKETDEIYVMKAGDKVQGMAILVAEPQELTVVNIVGFIDIDKLSLLEGKFGIPDEKGEKEDHKKPSPEGQHEMD
jgi:hypothetical protein